MELKNPLITIIFLSLIVFSLSCDCSKCNKTKIRDSGAYECTNCPTDSDCNCKWFVINTTASECLNCDKDNINDYYARVVTSDNEAFCKSLGISGFPYAKQIKGTHQILNDCKELELFEIGDECMQYEAIFDYSDYMENADKAKVKGDFDTKELICIYKYYIITLDNGLKSYKCLNEDELCPDNYKYIDSETNECINKCPKDKPKITVIMRGNQEAYYICTKVCNYTIGDDKYDKIYLKKSSLDPTHQKEIEYCYLECPDESHYYYEKEKKCLSSCKNNDFILSDNTRCSSQLFDCERDSYFIKNPITNFFKCAGVKFNNNCPASYSKETIDNTNYCTSKANLCHELQKYKVGNQCVLGCSSTQYLTEGQNICSNDCSFYDSTKNNRCVETANAAKCSKYFYKDENRGVNVCLDSNENDCEKRIGFQYLIEEEQRCYEECNGVLSLDGKKCYKNLNHQCTEENSSNKSKNGIKQCFCDFKYYYDNSVNRKNLKCLGRNVNCTSPTKLLINETNECVKYCPYKEFTKKYLNFCLRECPPGFEDKKDECICTTKHYYENDELKCSDTCPPHKNLTANKTQCVSNCNESSSFPYYFEGQCYKENEKPHNKLISLNINAEDGNYENKLKPYYEKFSNLIFYCPGVWYEYEENGNYIYNCTDQGVKSCDVFKNSYKYLINPMRRCVKNCSSTDFKYYFNNNCFSSCEKGNDYLFNSGDGKKIKANGNSYECICEGYWKRNGDEIECLIIPDNQICENVSYLLIVATKECYKGTKCPKEHPKLFNRRCYDVQCPKNSDDFQGNENTCQCSYNWYEVDNDVNKTKCLDKNKECPDNFPYLIVSQRKCVADGNDPYLKDKKIFRFNKYFYDNGCPANSIVKSSNDNDSNEIKECVCNPALGYWYKIENDIPPITFYNCSLNGCPDNYILADKKTKECSKTCSTFTYNDICYAKCPDMTIENGNICELKTTYEEDIEKVKENITNSSVIVDLYYSAIEGKDSEGIIEVKDGDETYMIEYYGLNPNKDYYKAKHNNKESPSSSLSYIDLIECINNLYKDNGMNSTDDIIVVKFDKVNTPKEYLINPVEYKCFHPVSGEELDMSACYNKKMEISYPFSKILENYENNLKKHRNLETVKLDIESKDISSLIEKYNIAKKINGEYPEIDMFNSNDYIYTNYCSSIQVNGTDIIIEDRINSLYPHYALCERNCTYNHTDYNEDRIYCDCTLKTEFDIKRDHPENVVINENAINLSQHGRTNFPVLKCIAIWKDFNRILQTIPFYYHLAIFVVEIILLILTLIFGIKNMHNYFENRICNLNNVEEDNMIIEINEKSRMKSNKKHKSGYIKTTERNLDNPPKKSNIKNKDKVDNNGKNEVQFIPDEYIFLFFTNKDKGVRLERERQFIPFAINQNTKVLLQKMKGVDYTNVKASGPFKSDQNIIEIVDSNPEEMITVSEKNSANKANQTNQVNQGNQGNQANQEAVYKKKEPKTYFINDNDELVEDKKYDVEVDDLTCFEKFKIEQRLLRKEYEIAQYKQENGFLFLMLAEILDKIYIMKIILFRQDYDIIYINLSIYLLYHVFLVNIIAMFFDMRTIQKIWSNENYPGLAQYIGFGLASIMICWIVYIILTCLMTNKGKYNEILDIKKSKKKDNKMKLIEKKYASLRRKTKIKISLYSVVQFIFIIFFTIYSVTLCAIFYGTMNKIYLTYAIALIEVLAIKILYGLVLSILRQVSLSYGKIGLYNAVLFMDNYIV